MGESGTTAAEMWSNISSGASSFVTGVVTPVMNMISSNPVCLAVLSVGFVSLAVKTGKKIFHALGRTR